MSGSASFQSVRKSLICGAGLGGVALHRVGSADLEMRECSDRFVEHNSAMVKNFLELSDGFAALMCSEVGFSAHIDGIQGSPTVSTARCLS